MLMLCTSPILASDRTGYALESYLEEVKWNAESHGAELDYYDFRTGEYKFEDEETAGTYCSSVEVLDFSPGSGQEIEEKSP
jgi:hypothetical protein